MTKAPKKPDSRAKALAGMTKAELIKTVKALDRKQTALLNQLAKLETQEASRVVDTFPPAPEPKDTAGSATGRMPWYNMLPNPYEGGE